MKRDEILGVLKGREAELKAQGVAHAALFGSFARGEKSPDSDIDIMVEIDPAADVTMDIFRYVGIVQYIEELFSVPVDVSDHAALKPYLRPNIERDALYAF